MIYEPIKQLTMVYKKKQENMAPKPTGSRIYKNRELDFSEQAVFSKRYRTVC